MKKIIEEMKRRLEADLAVCGKEVNPLKRLELSRQAARKAIIELENLLETSPPLTKDELIQYNKVWAAPFYAKWILFELCLKVEALKLSFSTEERANLFAHELREIFHFFRLNSEFCQHYYEGATDWDAIHFEKMDGIYLPVEGIPPNSFRKQNKGCIQVARILAYEAYRDYLTGKDRNGEVSSVIKNLEWQGTKTDLVELIIALLDFIHHNGKALSISEAVRLFETLFNIDLKDIYLTDHKNRNRKKDPAAFLTKIKEAYLQRQDRMDEARYQR